MKRLVAASTMLAFFVGTGTASAHVPGRVNCSKLFTIAHTEATARDMYAGTRAVTEAQLRRLGHMELCQVKVAARSVVRAYDHQQGALHASRVASVQTRPTAQPTSVGSMSALEACIISHESGGNPQAVNGQYEGIGQWSPTAWAQDGGTRYASSPLGATYAQQEAVLRGEGSAGMIQQQGQYDGCG